jgi:hypothetical protein
MIQAFSHIFNFFNKASPRGDMFSLSFVYDAILKNKDITVKKNENLTCFRIIRKKIVIYDLLQKFLIIKCFLAKKYKGSLHTYKLKYLIVFCCKL